ncbi:hypothetical protein BDV98DRAFT_565192 [Pterulicium gracile]|uniref:Uncharacterized protein n=1 Tax=Pterulicium gracile TaxID=1884261 RepID=A0A5C3QR32_9AGAR|nr:hypothetical protein BDV98DRAFT_565192 [Pterula gracilis]
MQNNQNAELVNLLDLTPLYSVVDFVVELLRITGYICRSWVALTRRGTCRLLICGEYKEARPHVSLVDRKQNLDTILLLVQEIECPGDNEPIRDPRRQLVA